MNWGSVILRWHISVIMISLILRILSRSLETDESEHDGLSPYGRQVVVEMNRLGIMVDVSHASKKAMLDIVRISRAPVIASHSGVYGLRGLNRNMDDEQLFALKKNGGVVQVVGYSDYLRAPEPARQKEVKSASSQVRAGFAYGLGQCHE